MGFNKLQRVIHPMGGWTTLFLFCTITFSLFIEIFAEQCVTRVLDKKPEAPFYDVLSLTQKAAQSVVDYLSDTPERNHKTISQKATLYANHALEEDENLLAVAIAGPSIPFAVVQFRGHLKNSIDHTNHTYLTMYWRELAVAWNYTDGDSFWGVPFRDCGPLQGRWLWPFNVIVQDGNHKIVASSFIAADINQCNDELEQIFGRKHSCDRETTFCLLTTFNVSAPPGSYTCVCRDSFFLPNQSIHGFEGTMVEEGIGNYSCIPCPGGCQSCDSNGVCLLGEQAELISMESLINSSISAILGSCILCCFVLSAIVFRQRKSKAIATGMWTILETILFGIILLYSAVVLHFFPASTVRCLLEPWCRELGFVICYGAIILKLYRHLVEFRTRKAHRWVVRDLDLLKYLCAMIVAVLCYLSAFTASSMDFLELGGIIGLEAERSNLCRPLKWDYVTQAGEMLILTFGLHLCFASRNAMTQFRERQFLVASISLEFIVSSTLYVLRGIYLQEVNSSILFIALFVRSQLTSTVTLGLIFFPKIWYQHKQSMYRCCWCLHRNSLQVRSLAQDLSCRLPVDAFKGSHDGHHAGGGLSGCTAICLGDPDIGDLTISEMNPEDIRAELKRLYTQLEILKNKTLRQDNPHISKRRGGRKVAHRRFSLQALSAKHRNHRSHHHEIEVTEAEPSRTPEDSVCSVEGPTDTGGELSGISISK